MAQAGHELLAQLLARLGKDGRVDGLVGDMAFGLFGEHALEGSGNVLRRPFPVQHGAHHAPADAAEVQLAKLAGTGGGYSACTLYTNAEEAIIELRKPIMLNGISVIVTAQDLLDRCLRTDLPTILSRELAGL